MTEQTEEPAWRLEAVPLASEHSVTLGNPAHWTECALLEQGLHTLPSVLISPSLVLERKC